MTNLAERLTKTERDQSHPNLKPRDAATLIVVDRSGPTPKVLLGKRHAGLKFMAGKFVFPGGRMEPGDRKMPVASELDTHAGARRRCRKGHGRLSPKRRFCPIWPSSTSSCVRSPHRAAHAASTHGSLRLM